MDFADSTYGLAGIFDDKPEAKKVKWKRRVPLKERNCDVCGAFFLAVNNEKRCSQECREEARIKTKRTMERLRYYAKR